MTTAVAWLEPLHTSLPEIDDHGWDLLGQLDAVCRLRVPDAPAATDQAAWSRWLLELRYDLATLGIRPPNDDDLQIWQTPAQFIAGFHNLDLRDATGSGHGAMILTHAAAPVRACWQDRLDRGDLVGIAATERHGGSRIREITTHARRRHDGTWLLTGEKCWVSRLTEAAAFVVFFQDPVHRISAATDPRLDRQVIEPHGLGGWSWGVLQLNAMPIDPTCELLGTPGDGLEIFRDHFTRFRPLVTATALGTAAGVHTLVTRTLAARMSTGVIHRARDNALISLGRTHAELTASLLATIMAGRLATQGHPHADLLSRTGKAAGVDVANRVVADLAPLIGAAGYQRSHPVAKARADLTGLLYADGIHDSLYRSGGSTLLALAKTNTVTVNLPQTGDAVAVVWDTA